jgi:hypothetical protein
MMMFFMQRTLASACGQSVIQLSLSCEKRVKRGSATRLPA